jgi:hypothetical protein
LVLKGHGFIRADKLFNINAALAAEGCFYLFPPIKAEFFCSLFSRVTSKPLHPLISFSDRFLLIAENIRWPSHTGVMHLCVPFYREAP